jgi:hypothetical protein
MTAYGPACPKCECGNIEMKRIEEVYVDKPVEGGRVETVIAYVFAVYCGRCGYMVSAVSVPVPPQPPGSRLRSKHVSPE